MRPDFCYITLCSVCIRCSSNYFRKQSIADFLIPYCIQAYCHNENTYVVPNIPFLDKIT